MLDQIRLPVAKWRRQLTHVPATGPPTSEEIGIDTSLIYPALAVASDSVGQRPADAGFEPGEPGEPTAVETSQP